MIDLKEYADLLKQRVGIENEKDANWKWNVKSVGKSIAHIGWGYLDYCGGWGAEKKKTFTIESKNDDFLGDVLTARHPSGDVITHLVVGGKYKDIDTAENGIKSIISAIAYCAHSQY